MWSNGKFVISIPEAQLKSTNIFTKNFTFNPFHMYIFDKRELMYEPVL